MEYRCWLGVLLVESIQLKSKFKEDGVIGQDFLIKYKAIIDMGNKTLFLK